MAQLSHILIYVFKNKYNFSSQISLYLTPRGSALYYDGKHEPMVTETEFLRVQALLGRKDGPRPQTHTEFPFTGLIRCGECGRMVTAEVKHQFKCGVCRYKFAYRNHSSCPKCASPLKETVKSRFHHYLYYHCSKSRRPECRQKCVSGRELERQIEVHLARLQISERFKDWAIKYLQQLHDKENVTEKSIIQTQEKAYRDCSSRLTNLVKLKTSPGNALGNLLSEEEYESQRAELLTEKAALEQLRPRSHLRVENPLKQAQKSFEFAVTLQKRFSKGDDKIKKEIVNAVGSNLTLKDKILRFEAAKPFFFLQEPLESSTPANQPIEPDNGGSTQGSQARNSSSVLSLRGQLHDDRTFTKRHRQIVRSVYQYLQKRASCGCEECREEFFNPEVSVKRRRRDRRWNALPDSTSKCIFKRQWRR